MRRWYFSFQKKQNQNSPFSRSYNANGHTIRNWPLRFQKYQEYFEKKKHYWMKSNYKNCMSSLFLNITIGPPF